MLSFSIEARINFIGFKRIRGWREKDRFPDKLKRLKKGLQWETDELSYPYIVFQEIQELRNVFAHGKPMVKIFVATGNDKAHLKDGYDLLAQPWERSITFDRLEFFFDVTDKVWLDWLDLAGISRDEAITHGYSSIDLIE